MFPQELASLSSEKLNKSINAEAEAEYEDRLVKNTNEAATVVFEGFRRLGERQHRLLREKFDGSSYIRINYADGNYVVHQDGMQTITFRQPAPELDGIAAPDGYSPQKEIVLARHLYHGFGLQPRKKEIQTFDWAVKTTVGHTSKEGSWATFEEDPAWLLNGASFIEFVPTRERAANSLLGYKEDLSEHRLRIMRKSTSDIVASMLFSLDLAKNVLEEVKMPAVTTAA